MSAHSTDAPLFDLAEVQYRDVPGFPGYRVGDDGSVWLGQERVRDHRHKSGYRRVILVRDGKPHHRLVHRLVLEAFAGPCPEGMEACHYPDPDKANNALSNLRWDSHAGNCKDAYRDRPPITEKRCRDCEAVKPVSEFYRDHRSTDGRKTVCKLCANQQNYRLWAKNPEKRRSYNREWMRTKGKRSG